MTYLLDDLLRDADGKPAEYVVVSSGGYPRGYAELGQAAEAGHNLFGGQWGVPDAHMDRIAEKLYLDGDWRILPGAYSESNPRYGRVAKVTTDKNTFAHWMNEHFLPDGRTRDYLNEALLAWNNRHPKPRVGDYVIHAEPLHSYPHKGADSTRFTHDWGDGLQAGGGGGHISRNGYVSYSGCLSASIPLEKLVLTDEFRPGDFWFFHDGFSGAHRGVYCTFPCAVFKEIA
jgi:hypothetical protein